MGTLPDPVNSSERCKRLLAAKLTWPHREVAFLAIPVLVPFLGLPSQSVHFVRLRLFSRLVFSAQLLLISELFIVFWYRLTRFEIINSSPHNEVKSTKPTV